MKTRILAFAMVTVAFAALGWPPEHPGRPFGRFAVFDPDSLTIPDLPYAYGITVSNVPGLVSKVTVTISNLNHTFPNELWVWLEGPSGSIAGLLIGEGGRLGFTVTNATLLFDDDAALVVDEPIVSGTYRPTVNGEYVTDPALFNDLGVFDGENPNGIWSLFIFNRIYGALAPGSCICGGWGVQIETELPHLRRHHQPH